MLFLVSVGLAYFCQRFLKAFLFNLLLEKARLQAEAKAAEEARRKAEAEAAAEAKRKRELEREAARQALQMVKWHILSFENDLKAAIHLVLTV